MTADSIRERHAKSLETIRTVNQTKPEIASQLAGRIVAILSRQYPESAATIQDVFQSVLDEKRA